MTDKAGVRDDKAGVRDTRLGSVTDKAGVRDLTSQLTPLIKALAGVRKIFLTPLARYWLKPCCNEETHHVNFKASGYLPALGSNIFRLRDYIRDALFTKRTSNYRVLCPNRMLGIGAHLSDEDAQKIGGLWGPDPVHPSQEAYKVLAASIEDDLCCSEARYTNPPKEALGNAQKKPRIDLAQTRQEWVEGCSATLPRRDTISGGVTPPRRADGDADSTAAEEVDGDAGAASPTSALSTGRETMAALEGGNSHVAYRQFYFFFARIMFDGFSIYSTVPYCNIKYENQ